MNKKALFLGIFIVIIISGIGFYSINRSSHKIDQGDIPGLEIWKQTLLSLNSNIALSIVDFVIDNDHFVLKMYTSSIKSKIKGFDYLIIVNKEGKILSHPDSSQILQDYKPEGLIPLGEKKNLIQQNTTKNIFDIASSIMLDDIRIGEVHLGIKDPWIDVGEKPTSDNLPKILLIVAAFVGLILAIIGAIGAPSPTTTVSPASKEKLEKFQKHNQELEKHIAELKKKLEEVSKKKGKISEKEVAVSERLVKLRTEETKLTKRLEEKKAEILKLDTEKVAMSASPEMTKIKQQLLSKDKEINNLKTQVENLKAQADTKTAEDHSVDLEEMKKEELELTQRIVKKRREEIILSQRVEAKRKEELTLERKIEALKKKIKETGS